MPAHDPLLAMPFAGGSLPAINLGKRGLGSLVSSKTERKDGHFARIDRGGKAALAGWGMILGSFPVMRQALGPHRLMGKTSPSQ